MFHQPAAQSGKDYGIAFKTRFGAWMFLLYGLVYAGFVAINLIKPEMMETTIMFGLNLATFYGFALIIVALILALIYNQICTNHEATLRAADTESEAK
ncbi:MAG: DUF485 domain-containing protein [Candidatus Riflebacteria bacterium]